MTAFSVVFALNLFGFIGVSSARILFQLYALELGASTATVAGITALMFVFPALLSWPIGALADRFGPRRLLAIGYGIGVAVDCIPYFFPNVGALYIASAIMGLTLAIVNVVTQNTLGLMSRPADRARNFSNFMMSFSVSNLVAPVLAGLAIDHAGFSVASLVVTAPLFLGFLTLAAGGRLLPKGAPQQQRAPRGKLLDALKEPGVLKILWFGSLSQMANDIFLTFVPIYGHRIGLSASLIGAILSTLAVGSFAVRVLLQHIVARLGEYRMLALAFSGVAIVLAFIPLVESGTALMALGLTYGFFWGCSQPLVMLLMFNQAADGRSGEAVGLRLTVNNLMRIVGPAVFGTIGTAAGIKAVFWAGGALVAHGASMSHALSKNAKSAAPGHEPGSPPGPQR